MPATHYIANCGSLHSLDYRAFAERMTLFVAIAVATCASMTVGIFPLVLGMFADRLSLSLEQTGVLATVAQGGFGIGGLLVLRLRRAQHWRRLLSGATLLAAILNGATMFAGSLLPVMCLQVLSGVAGGFAYGLAIYIVGRTPRPERAFGLMYTVGLAAYSVFAAAFPLLEQVGGFPWALNSLGIFLLISGALSWWLPDHDRVDERMGSPDLMQWSALLRSSMGLLALVLFELGIFAVWAYTERIGTLAGITPAAIGTAIAIGGLSGVAGAGTAAALGSRVGWLTPAIVGTTAIVAGNAFFWNPSSFPLFAAGSCLFNYGWMLAIPYFMGAVVASDRTGSLTSLLFPAQTTGAIIGPLVAAFVVGEISTKPAIGVSTLACLVAMAPLTIVVRRLERLKATRQAGE
jgi:predicted MFS family arabinose efflux permease